MQSQCDCLELSRSRLLRHDWMANSDSSNESADVKALRFTSFIQTKLSSDGSLDYLVKLSL